MTEESMVSVIALLERKEDFDGEIFSKIVSEIKEKYEYYEFIFVFGAAGSIQEIEAEKKKLKHVRLLRLTRSLPINVMVLAGLEHCIGDLVAVVKLNEVVPKSISLMLNQIKDKGDVVFGIDGKYSRLSVWKRAVVGLFGLLVKIFTGAELRFDRSYFMVLNRRAVMMIGSIKFKPVSISRVIDEIGLESYDFHGGKQFLIPAKWVDLLGYSKECIKTIVYDSLAPLRMAIIAGIGGGLAAFFYGVYTASVFLFKSEVMPGWTTTNIMISGFFSLVFFSLAILGEYLGRILDEVKKRPSYFLKDDTSSEISVNDLTRVNVVDRST